VRRWKARICIIVVAALAAAAGTAAQDDESAKADALWQQGKRLDALPLYEDLTQKFPTQFVYFERLAVGLNVKAEHSNDAAEVKALLTRERDAAKRAVELGDQETFVKQMAQLNPDQPVFEAETTAAIALFNEGEKAFGIGDYPTALARYSEAADANPKMYDAALYAGDAAYSMKDVPTAAKWFARAIAIDPNRETAYRYWGDALLRVAHDPVAAKPKSIDAIVAEPYNKLAWNGLIAWSHAENATLQAPKIDRPAGPVVDPKNPKNVTININPAILGDKKDPGASAWMMYSIVRASYHGDLFKKDFPDEKEYRHTLKEEDAALSVVASAVKEKKINPKKLDESLRNLVELSDAGMLDCWILINGADNGIAQDYAAYRKDHEQLLHDYIARFVVHGGVN
jgi:tetratricopeptide (TPR) repeat protein